MIFLPAFHHHKSEAIIIGRLLAGYGELEFGMCAACGQLINNLDKSIKTLFQRRGEARRIDRAYTLGDTPKNRGAYRRVYDRSFAAMRHCLEIRNQYAHCAWMYGYGRGLRFSDLEEIATDPNKVASTADLTQFQISEPLLREQEAYFAYVDRLWTYLNFEAQRRAGRLSIHSLSIPPIAPKPILRIVAADKFHLVPN